MGKILLLTVAIWLIITILKRYRQSVENQGSASKQETEAKSEKMVQCANCGVHLPKSDSLLVNDQYFCCEAHSKK